ncbi:MAG TPA: OmpH family outer membrane protein [Bacteroidetes bacterium]|nr:OmpH family outer membrane protein [Bacteroidota bacterium]
MIKQLFLIGTFLFSISTFSFAQRIAIVDVNAILENMDEYKTSQTDLDKIAKQWRQEIIKEQDKLKAMYNEYEAESVLMTEEMKKQKEDDIMQKEKAIRELQKGYFGPKGELFQKRQELVQPIEDKVFAAINEYAEDRGFDIILDRSSGPGVLFTSEKYDKTEDIKKKLGVK